MENLIKIADKINFLKNSSKSYTGFMFGTNAYNTFLSKNFKIVLINAWDSLNSSTLFIPKFYIRNEYVWQDGFLFDFLQKKTADAWVRRFVIYTGFIFSERLVFDSVVRLYIDNLI
jgi:hypothetical protein